MGGPHTIKTVLNCLNFIATFQPCGPYQAMKILTKNYWKSGPQTIKTILKAQVRSNRIKIVKRKCTGNIQQDQNCQEEMYREDPKGSKLCQEEMNVQGRSNRIKIVEVPGKTVRNVLVRNYPWQVSSCHSKDCFQCSTEDNPQVSCRKPGISYTITCTECAESGSKAVYHGESSKCGYGRGKCTLKSLTPG